MPVKPKRGPHRLRSFTSPVDVPSLDSAKGLTFNGRLPVPGKSPVWRVPSSSAADASIAPWVPALRAQTA